MSGLFCEPASGEGLLHGGGDKDTAFTVLRLRAAVESYAGTSGDLVEDGQEAFEARRAGDGYSVDERRDEVVGVFESWADGDECFSEPRVFYLI